MSDVEGVEREKVVLEVELADHTAPCEWFFGDQIIEQDERYGTKQLVRHRLAETVDLVCLNV